MKLNKLFIFPLICSTVFSSLNLIAQNYPDRNLFNFIFENNFEDDPLGIYSDVTFRDDWNLSSATLRETEKFDVLSDNDSYYNKYLRGYLEQGKYLPANHGWYWESKLSNTLNELYITYDIRFKPGFEWVLGGKMPFGMSGGPIASGEFPTPTSGWTVRTMWSEYGRLAFYVYHQDQPIQYGSSYGWGNFTFETGKWYNITIRVVLNSFNNGSPASDGILEGFIDGKLWFQKSNFKFRGIQSIEIDNLIFSAFFGGNTPEWASIRDEWIDTDNYIAYTYSNKITSVPIGNQITPSGQDLVHPYRPVPDVIWKKSLNRVSAGLTEIKLSWNNYPVPMSYTVERKDESSDFKTIAALSYGTKDFTDSNLMPDKSYTYRLKAGSAISDQIIISTLSPILPNVPLNLTASAFTKSGLTLTWVDNSTNETGFKIERSFSGTSGFVEIASTTANITNYVEKSLLPGTTYYYRIRAFNNDGYSAYSAIISANTLSLQIPQSPSGLIASQIDYTMATILWYDNSNNETGFELERIGPDQIKTILLEGNIESYTDKELRINSTYQYRIRAINSDGKSSWSNTIEVITPNMLPPAAPTKLKSINYTDKSISVSWNDNSNNEYGFILTRALAVDTLSSIDIMVNANDTIFTDSSLSISTTYIYTVKAVNPAGTSLKSNKNVATTLSQSELKRVKEGLIAYYNFGKNSDYIIYDQSGYKDPVNLNITDRSAIRWNDDNTLDINGNTALVSLTGASKIINALQSTNEITIECWIKPSFPGSYSSSRIISLGNNDDDVGFILDQSYDPTVTDESLNYSVRLQTSSTISSGYPTFVSNTPVQYISLQHIVYSRDKNGIESIFINGKKTSQGFRPSSFDSWNKNFFLRLGNESNMAHSWKGSFYVVAIYNKAHKIQEVMSNYSAGPCDKIENIDISYNIMVCPNPVSEKAIIIVTPEEVSDITPPTSISILNAFGNVINQHLIFNPNSQYIEEYDFQNYPSGIYLIRLSSGKRQKTVKIIKK